MVGNGLQVPSMGVDTMSNSEKQADFAKSVLCALLPFVYSAVSVKVGSEPPLAACCIEVRYESGAMPRWS